MRILITIMLLWSSVTAFSQEIWQLSPWAPDSSYVISAMSSGEPTWVKVDSLGVADSIYISGDSIRLRDGAGVAQLPTASTSTKGLLSSTDWNTFNNKFTLPSLTSGSVLFSNGSTISQDNSSFFWDDTNNRLGLGRNSSLTARLTLEDAGGLSVNKVIAFQNSGGYGNTWISKFNDVASRRGLHISGDNISGGETTAMTVDHFNGAKVGINNTTPTSLLHIGNASDQNGLTIDRGVNESISAKFLVNTDGDLIFRTTSGNVSIAPFTGTFASYNPSAPLHLFAPPGASTVDIFKIEKASGYGSSVMRQYYDGTTSKYGMMIGNGYSATNYLTLQHNDGFVGVGVDIPTRKLDVNGGLRIRDVVTTTPTKLMSIDNDGVVSSLGLSGLSISGGNLVGPTGTVTSVGINTGGGVTSVSGSPVTGSGNISLTLADQSASNELQTISTSGTAGNITLSNGGGTLNLNVNDADANATNELQNLTLTGQTLDISQGAGVTLPIIDVVQGSGITVNKLNGIATISASSAGSTEYIDPYIISSDTVGFILKNVMDTVQFIGVAGVTGESTTVSDSPTINMTLTGTNITGEIVDGSVTPAKLSQAYLTSEVDGSTTNEIQTLSISGSDLTISGAGGNTVTLPSGGGSSEWASLHYGSLAANTQTLTSSVWNTINFTGSSESNASIIDANHTNDEIEFVSAGTYRVDYRVSFIANADGLIYSGIYSSASSSVDGNTQMESDTDSGYKHTIMQHSYIKTAVAGEKIKLQVQPLIAHTSVAIYSNFIVTKL